MSPDLDEERERYVVLPVLAVLVFGLLLGWGAALVAFHVFDDDPADPVTVDAEAVVDATTIELHGYGPDGKPGVFVYECKRERGQLVCTQQEPTP